jgi:D-threo-aldose 1-dehydrogenase
MPDDLKSLFQRIGHLGFGGASIGNLYRPLSEEQAATALIAAIDSGITYIDTAPFYGFGLSEKRIGSVLADRDAGPQTILSSKVGRRLCPAPGVDLNAVRSGFVSPEPYEAVYDYSYDAVMRSWEESRQRLRGKRIDILLAHDLGKRAHGDEHAKHFGTFMDSGYRALRDLRDSGEISAVGLGVNEVEVCIEALQQMELDVILLASRYTLLEQSPLDLLFPLCAAKGVKVIVGGPYSSGVLATGMRNDARYDYGAVPENIVTKVAAIEQICSKYGIPLATAALQFPMRHPQVAAVIPGLGSDGEVRAARSAISTPIPSELWTELKLAGLLQPDTPI